MDLVFCAPPGLASDMDFCLRFDMPSGALPVGFDFGFADLLEPPPDFPFELLPLTEGLVAPILTARRGERNMWRRSCVVAKLLAAEVWAGWELFSKIQG